MRRAGRASMDIGAGMLSWRLGTADGSWANGRAGGRAGLATRRPLRRPKPWPAASKQRHRGVRDLTARFVQTYRSGALGREVVENGRLSRSSRPAACAGSTASPEKKTFVSDGKTFYFYVPADRQVIVREQADARGLPALLLSGRGGHPAPVRRWPWRRRPAGLQRLRLTPRKPDPEVEHVLRRRGRRGPHPRHPGASTPRATAAGSTFDEHPRERGPEGRAVPVRGPARGRGDHGMRRRRALRPALALAGCATSAAFRAGEQRGAAAGLRPRRARVLEGRAGSDPDNLDYRKGLRAGAAARLRGAHHGAARRLAAAASTRRRWTSSGWPSTSTPPPSTLPREIQAAGGAAPGELARGHARAR